MRRHHLACFRGSHRTNSRERCSVSRDDNGRDAAADRLDERKECCTGLHRAGLLPSPSSSAAMSSSSREGEIRIRDPYHYCLDHIAKVPTALADDDDDVAPDYYLIMNYKSNYNAASSSTKMGIRQRSNLQFEETSLSLFHHRKRTRENRNCGSSGGDDTQLLERRMPMNGYVDGNLSNGGGMHRPYHQSAHILLTVPTTPSRQHPQQQQQWKSDIDDNNYTITMSFNATIYLPISEYVFVDADGPLIGLSNGLYCDLSIFGDYGNDNNNNNNNNNNNKTTKAMIEQKLASSQCNITFIHSEIIDIEQPSFTSRQYVIAYQINGVASFHSSTTLLLLPSSHNNNDDDDDDNNNDSTISSASEVKTLEIVFKYGSTLHTRYPPPTSTTTIYDSNSNDNDNNINGAGEVDVVIQRPILYSASASLVEKYGDDDDDDEEKKKTMTRQRRRQQRVDYSFRNTKAATSTTPTTIMYPRYSFPLVISIAAGTDDHYWLVATVSTTLAAIGGLLVLRGLDSISIW